MKGRTNDEYTIAQNGKKRTKRSGKTLRWKKQEACGMCRVGNVKMVMNRKWTERKKEGQEKTEEMDWVNRGKRSEQRAGKISCPFL